MTQHEIIKMAHEAGLHVATDVKWMPIIGLAYAEKFAKLAAQHEREACANIAHQWSKREDDVGGYIEAAIRARSKHE
jgi:hypothetical protein